MISHRIDSVGAGAMLFLEYTLDETDGRWPSIKLGNVVSFPDIPGAWKVCSFERKFSRALGFETVILQAINWQPEPERSNGMNYSTAIFLVNNKVRAVKGIYEAWDEKTGQKMPQTGTFKTLDQALAVGDYVLVPTHTRHKMTVNKIVDVDVEPDLESGQHMDWVIGVVDFPAYQVVLAEEEKMIRLMKDAEKADRVKKLREKVLAHVDQQKLDALQITKRVDIDDDGSAPEKIAE